VEALKDRSRFKNKSESSSTETDKDSIWTWKGGVPRGPKTYVNLDVDTIWTKSYYDLGRLVGCYLRCAEVKRLAIN
jgi:hypothetical protein